MEVASDTAEMELMELMFNKESDGVSGAWETDRIVGVLGAAFSAWVGMLLACGIPVEAVLVEMLGIVDDLLQEAAEDEKAFGIEEGRVVGEVVAAAVHLFPLYRFVVFHYFELLLTKCFKPWTGNIADIGYCSQRRPGYAVAESGAPDPCRRDPEDWIVDADQSADDYHPIREIRLPDRPFRRGIDPALCLDVAHHALDAGISR